MPTNIFNLLDSNLHGAEGILAMKKFAKSRSISLALRMQPVHPCGLIAPNIPSRSIVDNVGSMECIRSREVRR